MDGLLAARKCKFGCTSSTLLRNTLQYNRMTGIAVCDVILVLMPPMNDYYGHPSGCAAIMTPSRTVRDRSPRLNLYRPPLCKEWVHSKERIGFIH